MLIGIVISGCCTKRDIKVLEEKIDRIEQRQSNIESTVEELEVVISTESEESIKLRAEIRNSVGDLIEQFRIIQANMTDLQAKIDAIAAKGSGRIIPPVISTTDTADTVVSDQPMAPGIECQELYDESFINLRREKYDESIQGFQDYLEYCGKQELADNARFWIGEAYYSTDRFQDAITQFQTMLDEYPASEKRPAGLYKLARAHEELGEKTEAKEIFQNLVDEFPQTLEAAQAKEKLKEL